MENLKLIKDLNLLEKTTEETLKDIFRPGDKIAVKLHMGEKGNPYFLKADVIKKIVSALNKLGLKAFLFDSPVKYPGSRDSVEKYLKTATEHGFTEENIGCPIVISDKSVGVKTKHLTIQVCKDIVNADGVLVVSHVKGHSCSAVGAAIKNLGMGAVSKETKKDIHDGAKPSIVGDCVGCGICKESCPAKCIEIKDGKAVFDIESCWGCSSCVINCPYNVLKVKNSYFDELLAEGAQAVLSKTKKVFFINLLIDIVRKCDCAVNSGPIIADDIGILFGKDIIGIDKASIDLINKQKPDVFKEIHHHDPYLQIKYAKELNLGEEEYDIS